VKVVGHVVELGIVLGVVLGVVLEVVLEIVLEIVLAVVLAVQLNFVDLISFVLLYYNNSHNSLNDL